MIIVTAQHQDIIVTRENHLQLTIPAFTSDDDEA
jgi:hypothetical protein